MGDANPSMIAHMIGSGKKRGVPFNIKCNDEKKAIRLNLHFFVMHFFSGWAK